MAAAAAQQLRAHGWCLLRPTPGECQAIDEAIEAAAAFFAQSTTLKASTRRAAAGAGAAAGASAAAPDRQRVATGGVGFLAGPTREWFHLAADDATLAAMRWPSAALRRASLRLLGILRQACAGMLHQLTDSEAAAQRLAALAAETERCGDPSVLDLFFYRNDSTSDGENMSSHSDPGLLTITPCSAVPGLEVQDAATGEWVDAETAEISGVSGKDGDHALLVFAGDSLEELGLRCTATAHRVRRADEPRLSLVYEMRSWECQPDEEPAAVGHPGLGLNPERSSEGTGEGPAPKRARAE